MKNEELNVCASTFVFRIFCISVYLCFCFLVATPKRQILLIQEPASEYCLHSGEIHCFNLGAFLCLLLCLFAVLPTSTLQDFSSRKLTAMVAMTCMLQVLV